MLLAQEMKERINFHTSYSEKESQLLLGHLLTSIIAPYKAVFPICIQPQAYRKKLISFFTWFFSRKIPSIPYRPAFDKHMINNKRFGNNIIAPYHPLAITPRLPKQSTYCSPDTFVPGGFTQILQSSILFQQNLGLLN